MPTDRILRNLRIIGQISPVFCFSGSLIWTNDFLSLILAILAIVNFDAYFG